MHIPIRQFINAVLCTCVSTVLIAGPMRAQAQNRTVNRSGLDLRSSMDVAITENSTLGIGFTGKISKKSGLRVAVEQTPYIDKDDGSTTTTNKTGASIEYLTSAITTRSGLGVTYLRDNGETSGVDYSGSYVIRVQSFVDRFLTNNAYVGLGIGTVRQRQAPSDGSDITNKTVYGALTLRAGVRF